MQVQYHGSQPQGVHLNVGPDNWGPVTKQPGTVVVAQPQRDWNYSLFGCMEDCGSCFYVACCGCCVAMEILREMGENQCLCLLMQDWLPAMRMKFRMKMGIPGSLMNDCCIGVCCQGCAMCQLYREVKQARQQGYNLA